MTQKSYILNALKQGRRITPLHALNEVGCFRLSAIIFDLRHEGHDIHTHIVGNNKHYAEYYLVQNGQLEI